MWLISSVGPTGARTTEHPVRPKGFGALPSIRPILTLLALVFMIPPTFADSQGPGAGPGFAILTTCLQTLAHPVPRKGFDSDAVPSRWKPLSAPPTQPVRLSLSSHFREITSLAAEPVFWSEPDLMQWNALDSSAAESTSPYGRSLPTQSLEFAGINSTLLQANLESPPPPLVAPWAFEGNGAQGVKTRLSERYSLEINPAWLAFDMFDSMQLNMMNDWGGPGVRTSQEWRNAFTVGVASDWHLTRSVAVHAGYRYYDNPIPDDVASGAYLNASQHVVAVGMSVREGRHSLSMVYGLDMMDPAASSGISSARYGNALAQLGHLVTMSYGFSF
jgi:hypothetical protein